MIRVHHLENSRSQRILWLLEEIERPYEVVRYARDPKTMLAPPELKAVHPLGKSPVVEDDGLLVSESGAVAEHLAEGTPLVPPHGTDAARRYREFLHFAEGSAMTPLLLKLYSDRLGEAAPALIRDRAVEQVGTILDFLEGEVRPGGWFCGPDLTAADILMSFPLELAVARGGLSDARPRLWDALRRMHERPAYIRAIERGGPYTYARP